MGFTVKQESTEKYADHTLVLEWAQTLMQDALTRIGETGSKHIPARLRGF